MLIVVSHEIAESLRQDFNEAVTEAIQRICGVRIPIQIEYCNKGFNVETFFLLTEDEKTADAVEAIISAAAFRHFGIKDARIAVAVVPKQST